MFRGSAAYCVGQLGILQRVPWGKALLYHRSASTEVTNAVTVLFISSLKWRNGKADQDANVHIGKIRVIYEFMIILMPSSVRHYVRASHWSSFMFILCILKEIVQANFVIRQPAKHGKVRLSSPSCYFFALFGILTHCSDACIIFLNIMGTYAVDCSDTYQLFFRDALKTWVRRAFIDMPFV